MRSVPNPVAIALTLCVGVMPALAGRPLVTEDAGVLERGECELESFASQASQKGQPRQDGLSVQLGCGVGLRSHIALARATERSGGSSEPSWALGGKVGLSPAEGGSWSAALAWSLAARRNAGSTSFRHEVSEVKGVSSIPLGKGLQFHAHLGHAYERSVRQRSTPWAVALEHATTPRLSLMTEAYGNDREPGAWVQAAARWATVPDRLYLDASLGAQARRGSPRLLTVGLRLPF